MHQEANNKLHTKLNTIRNARMLNKKEEGNGESEPDNAVTEEDTHTDGNAVQRSADEWSADGPLVPELNAQTPSAKTGSCSASSNAGSPPKSGPKMSDLCFQEHRGLEEDHKHCSCFLRDRGGSGDTFVINTRPFGAEYWTPRAQSHRGA